MADAVFRLNHDINNSITMGFIFSRRRNYNLFLFEGVSWTFGNICSRLSWIVFGLLLVLTSSRFFHRFDIKENTISRRRLKISEITFPGKLDQIKPVLPPPPVIRSYSIIPLVKAEFLLLLRQGPRWLWLVNVGGMIALGCCRLAIAHQVVLPILWVLQVGRLSELTIKEKIHRIHFFSYSSYNPVTRLLPAQLIAGILLTLGLASPLWIKFLVLGRPELTLGIILGGIFIVLFAAAMGMLSGGKKLFEILFLLLTYANLQRLPFSDYFAGINQSTGYLSLIFLLIVALTLLNLALRRIRIRQL
jgi:hypothetical protein